MNPLGGAGVIPATGQSFSDFGGQRRRAATAMLASTPSIPQGSADSDTFGAAGGQPSSAVAQSMSAGAAVRGLLMLIGILVLIRVAWEVADDATD